MNGIDLKKVGIAAAGGLIALVLIIWFILRLLPSSPSTQSSNQGSSFGTASSSTSTLPNPGINTGTNLPVFSSSTSTAATGAFTIFKITQGPVVGAVLIQPAASTTIARYITSEDGHVLDQVLGASNNTPHIVSNTTIPGIERALWTEGGNGVVVQYIDGGALKSAHLGLASATTSIATSTSVAPLAIHFLPDNLRGIASSPDGKSITYLLPTTSGTDGYISKPDGSNAHKLFSVPLSELVLSWPSPISILLYSKASSGVAGIAFSINAKTGTVSPILYGAGLTATANSAFSYLLYRTDNGNFASLFAENIKSNNAAVVAFTSPLDAPLPEQCVWSTASTTLAYCAAPATLLPAGYLDLWYRGESSVPDSLVAIDATTGAETPLATPGTQNGGEASDMIDLSLTPDQNTLSFIAKDDQSLWGIALQK